MAKFLDLEGLNYFWAKIKSWVLERFAYKSDLNQKLDKLRSGQNIKTINGLDITGPGNIEIQGGSSAVDSVNGKTGNVVLSANDVGAVPTGRTINGKALNSNITLNASDVGALPDSTTIPTKISDLNNDSSFTSVSIDRKVSSGTNIADITIDGTTTLLYAPTGGGGGGEDNIIESISVNGTAQTITNKNVDITVPTTLASLSDDETHRVVTDTEKSTWNGKSDFSGSYNDLTNKPTIPAAQVNADWNASSGVAQILNKPTIPTVPTNVSAFTNDAGYLTSFIEQDPVFAASAAYGITSSDITNWNNKGTYSKPSGGIPDSDIASASTWNAKYTKPSTGIPASDLESGVIPTVPTISTSILSDASDDTKTASPKAIKTYVDNICGDIETILASI